MGCYGCHKAEQWPWRSVFTFQSSAAGFMTVHASTSGSSDVAASNVAANIALGPSD